MVHVQQSILIYKKDGFRYGFPSKHALHARKNCQVMGKKLSSTSFSDQVNSIVILPD
jgi:hypothetical protein